MLLPPSWLRVSAYEATLCRKIVGQLWYVQPFHQTGWVLSLSPIGTEGSHGVANYSTRAQSFGLSPRAGRSIATGVTVHVLSDAAPGPAPAAGVAAAQLRGLVE